MKSLIVAILLSLCGEQIPSISEALNYEMNEVPATVTIIYKDQRVAFPIIPNITSSIASDDILLADPILCDDGDGWESLVEKTACQCIVFNYEKNKCSKFKGNC